MLSFEHIGFSYPGASAPALRDLCFSLSPGERLAVLGANGSGKSTLARLSNATLLADEGDVVVDGLAVSAVEDVREIRRLVGLVSQDPESQIVSSTVTSEAAFGPENLGLPREEIRTRVDAALAAVGLADKGDREPHTLSGGEKQRLVIAGMLAMQPRYLVFDEPTSMIDGAGRAEVLTLIEELHQRGAGVLHITHDLDEALLADRALVLAEGSIVFEGAPKALIGETDRLRRFGLTLSPMLDLASKLASRGLGLPRNPQNPSALAAAVVTRAKSSGGE